MPSRQQPCDTVERRAKVVAVVRLYSPGAQGYADAYGADRAPWFRLERMLNRQCGGERLRRTHENRAHRVANGLEYHPVISHDRFSNERVVAGERDRHRLLVLLP